MTHVPTLVECNDCGHLYSTRMHDDCPICQQDHNDDVIVDEYEEETLEDEFFDDEDKEPNYGCTMGISY